MGTNRRRVGVALLLAIGIGSAGAHAQEDQARTVRPQFLRAGRHVFNAGRIDRVEFGKTGDGSKPTARVFLAGERDAVILIGTEADELDAALGKPEPAGKAAGHAAPGTRFLARDDFDGALGLDWKPVRPDPSHISLTKAPGALVLTTQRGSIHGEEKKDDFGAALQARNLFLIDNPLAAGADFVATTCVRGFTPAAAYQQAGLIVYDDDDNYLKFGYEYNWPKGGGQAFCCVTETRAEPTHHYLDPEPGLNRYWVRLTKRGDRYEFATSLDGTAFRVRGEADWGDGAPRRIGLLAKNGGNPDAPESDAAFEFFELRAPVEPRAADTIGATR